jgi:hypothetical protein
MTDGMPHHYRWDVDIQLATTLDEYQQDRAIAWEASTDGRDWAGGLYAHAEKIADSLLHRAAQLATAQDGAEQSPQFRKELDTFLNQIRGERDALLTTLARHMPDRTLRDVLMAYVHESRVNSRNRPSEPLLKLVWERLCIHMAWPAVEEKIVVGANRILHLVELLARAEPSAEALQFLARVSRCFIWGFDIECVILCRAVIDSAFQSRVGQDMCARYCSPRPGYAGNYTLAQRIEAARREKIITQLVTDAARRVVGEGNNLLHVRPELTSDPLAVLEDTLTVIKSLFPVTATR